MSSPDRQNIRLEILKILYAQSGYVANQEVIIYHLKDMGIVINRDQLRIELAWLDKQADTLVDQATGGIHIATITGDGMDVVEGAKDIPGIRRPRPEELPRG